MSKDYLRFANIRGNYMPVIKNPSTKQIIKGFEPKRNDDCPCRSGKKYKKYYIGKDINWSVVK